MVAVVGSFKLYTVRPLGVLSLLRVRLGVKLSGVGLSVRVNVRLNVRLNVRRSVGLSVRRSVRLSVRLSALLLGLGLSWDLGLGLSVAGVLVNMNLFTVLSRLLLSVNVLVRLLIVLGLSVLGLSRLRTADSLLFVDVNLFLDLSVVATLRARGRRRRG